MVDNMINNTVMPTQATGATGPVQRDTVTNRPVVGVDSAGVGGEEASQLFTLAGDASGVNQEVRIKLLELVQNLRLRGELLKELPPELAKQVRELLQQGGSLPEQITQGLSELIQGQKQAVRELMRMVASLEQLANLPASEAAAAKAALSAASLFDLPDVQLSGKQAAILNSFLEQAVLEMGKPQPSAGKVFHFIQQAAQMLVDESHAPLPGGQLPANPAQGIQFRAAVHSLINQVEKMLAKLPLEQAAVNAMQTGELPEQQVSGQMQTGGRPVAVLGQTPAPTGGQLPTAAGGNLIPFPPGQAAMPGQPATPGQPVQADMLPGNKPGVAPPSLDGQKLVGQGPVAANNAQAPLPQAGGFVPVTGQAFSNPAAGPAVVPQPMNPEIIQAARQLIRLLMTQIDPQGTPLQQSAIAQNLPGRIPVNVLTTMMPHMQAPMTATAGHMPELPQLWALLKTMDFSRWEKMERDELFRSAAALRKVAQTYSGDQDIKVEVRPQQATLSCSVPLYFGNNPIPYPAFIHVYKQETENEQGKKEYEIWLRVVLKTENIGQADVIFRVYEGHKLDIRIGVEAQEAMREVRENLTELREQLAQSKLQLESLSTGKNRAQRVVNE